LKYGGECPVLAFLRGFGVLDLVGREKGQKKIYEQKKKI
jgi:hypothetical protein